MWPWRSLYYQNRVPFRASSLICTSLSVSGAGTGNILLGGCKNSTLYINAPSPTFLCASAALGTYSSMMRMPKPVEQLGPPSASLARAGEAECLRCMSARQCHSRNGPYFDLSESDSTRDIKNSVTNDFTVPFVCTKGTPGLFRL